MVALVPHHLSCDASGPPAAADQVVTRSWQEFHRNPRYPGKYQYRTHTLE